ncbi:hypothetical protein LEP1GSC131_1061 [Leptospira kirschneri str. 200802841]|uniref:Uncharacterized protein n=1 Tax=Leptospira kirschneri str. 200802841 TaxID=1193047 RepID=A0A828Y2T3_9LEPT|nr:hypothetical protein LEP1GSC131_1061 [Leptospira kirschneri str. 200802841]
MRQFTFLSSQFTTSFETLQGSGRKARFLYVVLEFFYESRRFFFGFFIVHTQDFVLRLRFARVLTSHSKRHCRFSVLRLVVRLSITKVLRTSGTLLMATTPGRNLKEDFKSKVGFSVPVQLTHVENRNKFPLHFRAICLKLLNGKRKYIRKM